MGFVEECSPGSTMACYSGEEIALIKPACGVQVVYDHGDQPKGTALMAVVVIEQSSCDECRKE